MLARLGRASMENRPNISRTHEAYKRGPRAILPQAEERGDSSRRIQDIEEWKGQDLVGRGSLGNGRLRRQGIDLVIER